MPGTSSGRAIAPRSLAMPTRGSEWQFCDSWKLAIVRYCLMIVLCFFPIFVLYFFKTSLAWAWGEETLRLRQFWWCSCRWNPPFAQGWAQTSLFFWRLRRLGGHPQLRAILAQARQNLGMGSSMALKMNRSNAKKGFLGGCLILWEGITKRLVPRRKIVPCLIHR